MAKISRYFLELSMKGLQRMNTKLDKACLRKLIVENQHGKKWTHLRLALKTTKQLKRICVKEGIYLDDAV